MDAYELKKFFDKIADTTRVVGFNEERKTILVITADRFVEKVGEMMSELEYKRVLAERTSSDKRPIFAPDFIRTNFQQSFEKYKTICRWERNPSRDMDGKKCFNTTCSDSALFVDEMDLVIFKEADGCPDCKKIIDWVDY